MAGDAVDMLAAEAIRAAADLGVRLEVDVPPDGDTLHVTWIERTSGKPGTGMAALREACRLADLAGIHLELVALDSAPALIRTYSALGFVEEGEVDDGIWMSRVAVPGHRPGP